MKKVYLVATAALLLVIGFTVVNAKNQASSQVDTMRFSAIQDEVTKGAILYDVRTSQEYANGHIAGAANWSLQDMQAGTLPDAKKDTKIYVYCQSGNRSSQAAKIMNDAGFTNVVDLGGIQDVLASGGKLE